MKLTAALGRPGKRWPAWGPAIPRLLDFLYPLLVLAISLGATHYLWDKERRDIERHLKTDFDFGVQGAAVRFEQRLLSCEQVLRGLAGFMEASIKTDAEAFKTYVDMLQIRRNFPAIRHLGFARLEPGGEHSRTLYIESGEGANHHALDYDDFGDPARQDAMVHARDSGQVAIANKVALLNESEAEVQPGLRMYFPVYTEGRPHESIGERRAGLVGWAYAQIDTDGVRSGLLSARDARIALDILDETAPVNDELIHEAPVDRVGGESAVRLLHDSIPLHVGGYQWTLSAYALPDFASPILTGKMRMIASVGIAISLLLTLFVGHLRFSRARLERTMEVQRSILDNAGTGIVYIRDRRFVWVNHTAEKMLGYKEAELVGRLTETIYPSYAEFQRFGELAYAGLALDGYFSIEQIIKAKDGHCFWSLLSGKLIDRDRPERGAIWLAQDITKQHEAQDAQRRLIDMISHEFRTPLATIDGAIQMLAMQSGQADAPTRKRYAKIQSAVDRLVGLLEDYLTMERLDSAARGLRLAWVSAHDLLLDSQSAASALSAEHSVEVMETDLPGDILCDPDLMRLALRVLADNAVNYTPAGSRISLQSRRSARGGVEFIVADDGPGIPEDELAMIFDKYFRGRGSAERPGSGMGLNLARDVVARHGGTLTARNRPEGGAEFIARLPDTNNA